MGHKFRIFEATPQFKTLKITAFVGAVLIYSRDGHISGNFVQECWKVALPFVAIMKDHQLSYQKLKNVALQTVQSGSKSF